MPIANSDYSRALAPVIPSAIEGFRGGTLKVTSTGSLDLRSG